MVDKTGEAAFEDGWADGDRAFCLFSIAAIIAIMRWISSSLAWSESSEGVVDLARAVGARVDSLMRESAAGGRLASSSDSSSSSEMSITSRRGWSATSWRTARSELKNGTYAAASSDAGESVEAVAGWSRSSAEGRFSGSLRTSRVLVDL